LPANLVVAAGLRRQHFSTPWTGDSLSRKERPVDIVWARIPTAASVCIADAVVEPGSGV